MFTYQGREETILQGIVSRTHASPGLSFYRENAEMCKEISTKLQKMHFALEKSYLEKELGGAAPARLSHPGL